jgi:hypothetical protein
MPSTFTQNKNLELPANGSYDDSWNVPVNSDFSVIDQSLAGNTTISVTGISTPTNALTTAQYTPPNIIFSGVLSTNLTYVLPAGVGWLGTIFNNTTGAYTLTFGVSGGGSVQFVPSSQGTRTLVVCDGVNMQVADTGPATAAQSNAATYTNTAVANERALAANASNLSSGTVPNAQLPNPGVGPGVTIAPDPGTVPSGAPGSIWYYY